MNQSKSGILGYVHNSKTYIILLIQQTQNQTVDVMI